MSFKNIFKDKIKETPEKIEIIETEEKNPEKILINNGIKIKSKFGTKFGTEFVLFKQPDSKKIKNILKGFKISFNGNSIFVQNL